MYIRNAAMYNSHLSIYVVYNLKNGPNSCYIEVIVWMNAYGKRPKDTYLENLAHRVFFLCQTVDQLFTQLQNLHNFHLHTRYCSLCRWWFFLFLVLFLLQVHVNLVLKIAVSICRVRESKFGEQQRKGSDTVRTLTWRHILLQMRLFLQSSILSENAWVSLFSPRHCSFILKNIFFFFRFQVFRFLGFRWRRRAQSSVFGRGHLRLETCLYVILKWIPH